MESYVPPKNGFRTFLILWISQSVSVFGSALTFFCITVWLTQVLYPLPEQRAELSMALAAASLAWGLPALVLAPIAGALADRRDKRNTMILGNVFSGLISVTLTALLVSGDLTRESLVVLLALMGAAHSFHAAAFDTSYAMLVPKEQLPRANGMMQTMWALSTILSPAIAASLMMIPSLARQGMVGGALGRMLTSLSNGAPLATALDSVTFFLAALALVFITLPSLRRDSRVTQGSRSLLADVVQGARYIWRRSSFLWLLGTFSVINFAGPLMRVLEPMLIKFRLAPDCAVRGYSFEAAMALLASTSSAGGVVGGLLISAWGGLRKRRVYGVVLPVLVSMFAIGAYGLSTHLILSVVLAFTISAMSPIMNAHSQTIWQSQTPLELQGRVFAVRRLIAQCTAPLSTALGGILASRFDPPYIIAVVALLGSIFTFAQLFNPHLLRVEDREWIEARALSQNRSS